MKQFSKFLALGLLSAAAPMAFATPIDFTLAPTGSGCVPSGNNTALNATCSYQQNGYTISQFASTGGGASFVNGNRGVPAPGFSDNGIGTDSIDITYASGDFSLLSLDLAAATGGASVTISEYSNLTPGPGSLVYSTGPVSISAFLATGTPGNYSCSGDGAYSNPGSTPPTGNPQCYEAYTLAQTPGVDEVVLAFSGPGAAYVDGIQAQAPEPSSLMLLGTGLVSACGVMYRKRRATIA